MIVAYADIPKVVIPKDVRRSMNIFNVETSTYRVPFGADIWIGGRHVWPHIDEYWDGQMFITMVIEGDHLIEDAKSFGNRTEQPPGTIAIIDPMTLHWLAPRYFEHSSKQWIGVQWEVPKDKAKAKLAEIMSSLKATWINEDPRYKSWKPKRKKKS